jgi:hypothetical protein
MSNLTICVSKLAYEQIRQKNLGRTVTENHYECIDFPGFSIRAAENVELIQDFLPKEKHPTEIKYPEQTKRFREILDEMYQTHLKKNADYSAYNINGTGVIGLTVRFWDKCARLMNLMGFDIGTGEYTGPKKNLVLDESVIDTVQDAAVYSIIFKIWSEGKWGK